MLYLILRDNTNVFWLSTIHNASFTYNRFLDDLYWSYIRKTKS